MMSLQEYDLEITLSQIVRGQGLCKLLVDSVKGHESQINTLNVNQHNENQITCAQVAANSWYENIKFYLTYGSSPHYLGPNNRGSLRLKYTSFWLINYV
jgi:hypothetical protein